MVIRLKGVDLNQKATKRPVLPNVAAVIEFIRERRRTTREKAINLEQRSSTPSDYVYLRKEDANREEFNPTMADLDMLYSKERRQEAGFDLLADPQVTENFKKDQKVLDDLIPEIIPDDSYFEKEERDVLESREHPLRFPAKVYIRKSYFCNNNLIIKEQKWRHNLTYFNFKQNATVPQASNRYTITLLNDVNLQELLPKIINGLQGLLRVSVDAYYIAKSIGQEFDSETGHPKPYERYGLIYPNSWGSVNETEIIYNQAEMDKLLEEIRPDVFGNKLVENTFLRRDVYGESNVTLHRILAYQVVIQALPANLLFK